MKYIPIALVASCVVLFLAYCLCFDDVVEWDVATIERNCTPVVPPSRYRQKLF